MGGGERYVHYLAQALRQVRPEWPQRIVTLGKAPARFSQDGIEVVVLANESPLGDGMRGLSPGLAAAARDAWVVHVHQCLTLFGAYAVAALAGLGPRLVGTDLGGEASAMMFLHGGLAQLDGMVSISAFARDLLGDAYAGPQRVLIGPLDTDRFRPAVPPAPREADHVLCVGRILPHKGLDRVIAALPPGLRLSILGQPYDRGYLRLLHERAAGRPVRFVHAADDATLLDHYRRAGLLVQASTTLDVYGERHPKAELMGLTALEAMACGLPVLVAATTSLPELVPDARFGRVFASDAELAEQLRAFRDGAWPVAEVAGLARAHVERCHGPRAIGAALAGFYAEVAG